MILVYSKDSKLFNCFHRISSFFTFLFSNGRYFLNLVLDTTIGVLIMSFLVWLTKRFVTRCKLRSVTFGDYGEPPKFVTFLKQLGLFLLLAIIMKVSVLLLLLLFLFLFFFMVLLPDLQLIVIGLLMIPFFEMIAAYMLSPLKGKPSVELVVVMVITPLIMNTFQFWVRTSSLMFVACCVWETHARSFSPQVVDQIIKKKKPTAHRTAAAYFEDDNDSNELMLADDFYGIDEKL